MKLFLMLFTMLLTSNAFAVVTYSCVDKANDNYSYALTSVDYEHYKLVVTKRVLDPNSCGSRWGCDYLEETIYTDLLKFDDIQGAGLFTSKRVRITMESMDDVSYSFTYKAADGTFKTAGRDLKCE